MVRSKKLKTSNQSDNPTHHRVRSFFSTIFGLIALLLIFFSILAVWLNSTLTNNGNFVSTLAPLSEKPAIQNFIVNKAGSTLISNNNLQNLANQLLPANEASNPNQPVLKNEVTAAIDQKLQTIVSAPAFSQTWKSTITSAQSQFVGGVKSSSSTLTMNLHPAIVSVANQLQSALPGNNQLNIKPTAGIINISGKKLNLIRKIYNWFETGTWLVIFIALVFLALCIWTSVHHLKTIKRVFLTAGILSLIFALIIYLPNFLVNNSSNIQTKAILTFATTLLHSLFLFSLIFGVISIILAFAIKPVMGLIRK